MPSSQTYLANASDDLKIGEVPGVDGLSMVGALVQNVIPAPIQLRQGNAQLHRQHRLS
jgi:hypothetical protein